MYSYQKVYTFLVDPVKSNIEQNNYSFLQLPLLGNHQYGPDNPSYPMQISTQLSQGHYHIALVEMSKSNHKLRYVMNASNEERIKYVTGHWVVITGMSAQWDYGKINSNSNWVRIYNPYFNQDEYYKWDYFRSYLHSASSLEMWYGY